ncbi:SseB family protein [Arthrobacter halodurans]|uniref:SseB family protein n=1 Tax=Arthrobacter halodurans TaxID=516699 RepID=A0ABV4UQB3_9MICC
MSAADPARGRSAAPAGGPPAHHAGFPAAAPARHLPGHIAAALERAGGGADSAGRPWAGRDLGGEGNPLHRFDQDDGAADAGYEAAIAALLAGTGSEEDVHRALASARVFIPVVATLADGGVGAHGFAEDKEADMALVTLTAPDGRRALPAFTTAARLGEWHPEARPVAVYAARAALSAVAEDAQLLVIDPGADVTFVLRRPGVWALAQQQPWLPSYRDPAHLDLLGRLAEGEPAVAGIAVGPGRGVATRSASGHVLAGGGPGPELRVELTFRAGTGEPDARAAATRIQRALGADAGFAEGVDSLELSLRSAPPSGPVAPGA